LTGSRKGQNTDHPSKSSRCNHLKKGRRKGGGAAKQEKKARFRCKKVHCAPKNGRFGKRAGSHQRYEGGLGKLSSGTPSKAQRVSAKDRIAARIAKCSQAVGWRKNQEPSK